MSLLLRRLRPSPSLLRPFSSSSPIKPVSYAVKPKEPETTPPPPPPSPSPAPPDTAPQQWTRAEARYMKDVPVISPVSYPLKVAPLPEYKPNLEEKKIEEEGEKNVDDVGELQREARRIQTETRARGFFSAPFQQAVEKLRYPTIFKKEKNIPMEPIELKEAIRLVKAAHKRETVEAHVNLGVDPRRGDQMVRGFVKLPHGSGKTVRVAVFAEGPAAEEARAAGADVVGGDDLIEQIKNDGGKLTFDKCISTPTFMPRLSKVARILGPKGLMPNPKLGSVTNDVSAAVKDAKSGRIDFKIDKTGIVHVGLGKVNFSPEALLENIGTFVNALLLAKPVGLKKTSKYAGYVKKFTLTRTQGPGYPVTIQSISQAADSISKLHVK